MVQLIQSRISGFATEALKVNAYAKSVIAKVSFICHSHVLLSRPLEFLISLCSRAEGLNFSTTRPKLSYDWGPTCRSAYASMHTAACILIITL